MRELSSFFITSVRGPFPVGADEPLLDPESAGELAVAGAASIAICEMSRRDATSESSDVDGWAALIGETETGADSAGVFATARRFNTVPAPRRMRSSTTS